MEVAGFEAMWFAYSEDRVCPSAIYYFVNVLYLEHYPNYDALIPDSVNINVSEYAKQLEHAYDKLGKKGSMLAGMPMFMMRV